VTDGTQDTTPPSAVVDGRDAGAAEAIGAAIDAGERLLVRSPGALAADRLAALAARADVQAAPVSVAFAERLGPVAADLRGSLASGAVGLPQVIHVEARGVADTDPVSAAADLLDLILEVSGLTVVAAAPSSRVRDDDPVFVALRLTNGVIASVAAVSAPSGDGAPTEGRRAIRVQGSHGSLSADLAGPYLQTAGGGTNAMGRSPFGGPPAADRLVATFAASGSGLASLGAAARLLAVVRDGSAT
jgi:predicted dehydrogenase